MASSTQHALLSKKVETALNKARDSGIKLWYFKVHGHAMQKKGVPDLVLCIFGLFVTIEIKAREADIPSPVQRATMKRIMIAGGKGYIVRSVEDLNLILAGFKKAKDGLQYVTTKNNLY